MLNSALKLNSVLRSANLRQTLVLIRWASSFQTAQPKKQTTNASHATPSQQSRSGATDNDAQKLLIKRPPVVTIMGHVDHGKTTLLDYLRNSKIVQQEFGGITQHIGAFVVPFKQHNKTELVTFLDTPGHAAFAAMRQRGANVTDIVVLVVACEDGVLDQTVESIRYAKNSDVPIIVAVNKIDKFLDPNEMEKRIELIRRQLVVHDVISEADGGDVQLIKMSALKGVGVDDLKEAILALAETLELKAEINCPVSGHIIESLVDPHRGKLCTVLVDKGRLVKGSVLIAGTKNWARVRALFDERGLLRQSCGPGEPIQVTGWREEELPAAGDPILQVSSDHEARSLIHKFRLEKVEKKAVEDANEAARRYQEFYKIYKEKLIEKRDSGRLYGRILFTPRGQRPKESQDDEAVDRKINLILKCDVDGSLDALLDILDTYDRDNRQPVKLDLMHYGVGQITENDYKMAESFPNSVIYGFNVKPANQKILVDAKKSGVNVKLFNVIYHLIDDLKMRLSEKIPESEKEIEIGRAVVMQEFVVNETKKQKTHVAGCTCLRGSLKRKDVLYKLLRNNETIIQDMEVRTMKHLKDDVQEIEKDRECGLSFLGQESFVFKPGDQLVCYEKKKYRPALRWNISGFS
jgi:translation initiation factor IF-2